MNNWTNSNLLSTRTSNSASCKWNAPCFLSLSLRTCKQIKKPLLSMLNSASHDFNAPCFVSLSTPKQVKNLQESSPIGDNQCNACAMSWGLSSDICNYNHKYFCLLPRFYSLGDLKGHSRTLIMTLCRWFGYDFLLVAIKTMSISHRFQDVHCYSACDRLWPSIVLHFALRLLRDFRPTSRCILYAAYQHIFIGYLCAVKFSQLTHHR